MPRRYRLGKRAVQLAETRRRIIEAAAALYQELGVSGTTIQDVARRADVAPGTVLNHFESSAELARAVGDHLIGSLQVPGDDIFIGLTLAPERVARIARELFAFYERSSPWYEVYAREPSGVGAWAGAEVGFYDQVERLIRTALGPLAEDQSAVAAVSAVLGAGVYSTLRARGLSTPDAADLVVEVLSPWLERSRLRFSDPG
jgi:AcrR family transcriptional regulator